MRREIRRRIVRYPSEGAPREAFDTIVAEEPLEIRISGRTLVVTMRTPGDDFDLAAGFCFTEGVLGSGATIRQMRFCDDGGLNVLDITLDGEAAWHERSTVSSAACGVCGKTAIEDVLRRLPPVAPGPVFERTLLAAAPDRLEREQSTFRRTGGLHAAGLLATDGAWLSVREDVGRHNAVDKVIGWALREGRLPLRETAIVVSGRAGFEIVEKALAAGIPALVAVGAPTSLAVDIAAEGGITLAGFARRGAMTVYTGEDRIGGPGTPPHM